NPGPAVDATHHVEDRRANRGVAARRDDALLRAGRRKRLVRCAEAGADQHARRAQRDRRFIAAAIGDAACRPYGFFWSQTLPCGKQREERPLAAMAARFRALRYQYVGLRFERLPRDRQALDLADQLRPGAADFFGEWARIAERKHHGGGFVAQREIEQRWLLGEAPGDEADA